MYEEFHRIIARAINISNWEAARIVQGKIVEWLRSEDETEAADWFQKYWCGPRGNWTIADSGVGGVPNGCGVESKWEKLTRSVCGNAGKSKSLRLNVFIPGLSKYLTDVSYESACEHMKEFGTHRFLNQPRPTPAMWGLVHSTDIRVFLHAQLDLSKENQRHWDKFLDELILLFKDRQNATLVERLDKYFSLHKRLPFSSRDVKSIVIPSRPYIIMVDKYSGDRPSLGREDIDGRRQRYFRLMSDPIEFNAAEPDLTAENWLSMNGSFHFLTRDQDGGIMKWRCSCRAYFDTGGCEHALIYRKCFYPTTTVPAEFDTTQLEKRSSSRIPSPFAKKAEPTFQSGKEVKLKWNPSGLSATSRPQVLDSEPNSEEEFILNISRGSRAASVASTTGGARASPASGASPAPGSGACGGLRGDSSGGRREIENSGGVQAVASAGVRAADAAAARKRTAIAAGETPPVRQKRKVTSALCPRTI